MSLVEIPPDNVFVLTKKLLCGANLLPVIGKWQNWSKPLLLDNFNYLSGILSFNFQQIKTRCQIGKILLFNLFTRPDDFSQIIGQIKTLFSCGIFKANSGFERIGITLNQ